MNKARKSKISITPLGSEGKSVLLHLMLRSARRSAGLTIEQLSRESGVAVATLHDIESERYAYATVRDLFAVAEKVGLGIYFRKKPAALPTAPQAILKAFDRLVKSKEARFFLKRLPDREYPQLFWDIVGDPIRNWLFVVVSNSAAKVRFGAVTDDPGGWSIAGQKFGIDAETHAIAEQLSERLLQRHKSELLQTTAQLK